MKSQTQEEQTKQIQINKFGLTGLVFAAYAFFATTMAADTTNEPTTKDKLAIATTEVTTVAALTLGTMAILRKHALPKLEGGYVIILATGIGILFSFGLGAFGLADLNNIPARIVVGIVGGISASGVVDATRRALKIT